MVKVMSFVDRWLAGGIESYLVTNYENMSIENMDITIVTTKKYTDLYDERLNNLGIKLVELIPHEKTSELNRTYKSLKNFRTLLSQNQYDLMHLNIYNGVSLVYARVAKQSKLKRVIAHSHNSAIGNVRLKKIKIYAHTLGKRFYRNDVDDCWACSDLAAEWLFAHDDSKPALIMNNGIDTNKFKYDAEKGRRFREKWNLSENQLVLGNIGRLNNQKNQIYLIELAESLKNLGQDFKMVIAGDGELREDLLDRIKDKGLEEQVQLIGTIQDTVSFYSGIDYFLLPSLFEGNPIVAIEAQATGVNCILSSTITQHAKLSPRTTYLPLKDVEHWVECIMKNEKPSESEREQAYLEVKAAGFDILDTAGTLSSLYLK